MTGQIKALLYSAAAAVVTISAILQSPSAQSVAGPGEAAQVSTSETAPAEMPNSVTAASAVARAKADAEMATKPASVSSPSGPNSGYQGYTAQPTSSGMSEMPNPVTPGPGSAAANARAAAAMVIDPHAAPVPFPTGKPASNPNPGEPK